MILQRIIRKLKRPDHTVAVRIKVVSPPLKHQAALVKVLGFAGIHSVRTLSPFLNGWLTYFLNINQTQSRH